MDEQKLDVTAQQPDAALHAQTEEITNEALPEALLEQQAAQAELSQAIEASAEELQPEQAEQTTQPERVTVVDIRFRNNAKTYFFDPGELRPVSGDHVIIETARGDEYGICAGACHEVKASEIVPPLRKVLRMATAQDERINRDNQEKEKRAFEVCQQKIADHKLEMQLVSAEVAFDGSKILFFFTAEGRVDFRALVKDLASTIHARIELRQIGVRDEAKMLGGLGICGRPFCCHQFLDDFQPVSTKMAKTQSMSLNPVKISGTCGRLMCCLRYEQEAYEDLLKHVPKNGAFVQTEDGYGSVTLVNLLRQNVKVKLDGPGEAQIRTYDADEIAEIPGGRPAEGQPLPDLLRNKPKKVKEENAEPETNGWIMPSMIVEDVCTASAAPQSAEKPSGEKKSSRSRRRKRGGANAERSERAEKKPERSEKKPVGENRSARRGGEKPPVSAAPAGDKAERTDKPRRNNHRRRKPRPKTDGEAKS